MQATRVHVIYSCKSSSFWLSSSFSCSGEMGKNMCTCPISQLCNLETTLLSFSLPSYGIPFAVSMWPLDGRLLVGAASMPPNRNPACVARETTKLAFRGPTPRQSAPSCLVIPLWHLVLCVRTLLIILHLYSVRTCVYDSRYNS